MTNPITLPVGHAGSLAGTLRRGQVDAHPVHAAACARCRWALYDQPAFDATARRLRDHLAGAHRIGVVCLDLRGLRRHRAWWLAAGPVVAEVGRAWGVVPEHSVVTWRAGGKRAA